MKKKGSFKAVLKKNFPGNPLFYLGWLGFLGVLGILFSPLFLPFLLCFSFFGYGSMPADELFWQNVHRSSSRAFWAGFALDTVVALTMLMRGLFYAMKHPYVAPVLKNNLVTVSAFSAEQYAYSYLAFFGSLILMLLVFTISMMQFRRQEKKELKELEETEM